MDSIAAMRVFARVVESGSFSAVGRQLGMAPSSVSRQVGDLEQDLGARLFHRTTRKLSLTEAGRLYHARATRILVEVEEARLAVAQIDGTPSGVLRLTVPAGLGPPHIAPALAEFHRRFPAVKVCLSVTDRLIDLVEEGFDLAVRIGGQRDSSLIARKIASGRRLLAGSPAYLKSAGRPKLPDDLVGHNCLTFRLHPGRSAWAFRGSKGTSEVRVSGSLLADSAETLCAAAVAGLGLVLVPEWLIEEELRDGRLRPVLSDFPPVPASTPLYAVYPHQRHLPPKVRACVDFLAERFAA